jgi:hypothetical protein
MRGVRLLVALGLSLTPGTVGPAAGGASESDHAPLVRHFERSDGRGDRLGLVDPKTLRPVSPLLRTFVDGFGGSFSPDGRLFAYGNGFDGRALVHLIDVQDWSTRARLDLGGDGPVGLSWPTQTRLIAVVGAGSAGPQRLLVLAAPGSRVLARRTFRGRWLASAAAPLGLTLLVAPERGIGPPRILFAGAGGDVRAIELGRIRAGGNESRRRAGRLRVPGLTVDPEAGVAYVPAAGPLLVARIDLGSGAVTYHALRSLDPARPAVAAKGNVAAWWREASWLGEGRIAVTGNYEAPFSLGRRSRFANRPFGVRLIDVRDWTIRTLHPGVTLLRRAGERLLAYGTTWRAGWRRSDSTGLLAFDTHGQQAFTRFPGRDVSVLGSHGQLAYVWVRPTRMLHVLDLQSGRSLRSTRVGPARLPYLFSASEASGG